MRKHTPDTLVNLSPSGASQPASSAAPAPAAPAEHLTFQQRQPVELEKIREHHHAVGVRLGRVLGMTTDWARTRWVAGPTRGTVLPRFFIRVPGPQPDRATGELITRRLTRHGWGGRLIADDQQFRVDARRDDARLVLVAHEHTIALTIAGGVLAIGPTQKLHLLAGAYEDDLDS